jgi:hypothetical protein
MLIELKEIKVPPDSELARLLEAVGETPLILEKDGVRYHLRREGSKTPRRRKTAADYEAFLSAAGSWKDVDTDKLIADIYESRRRSSGPPIEL